MCYDVESLEFNSLRLAIRRTNDPDEKERLQHKLQKLYPSYKPYYHISGFAHPQLLVFTNTQPFEPQLFQWGLIPAWVKDEKTAKSMMNQTLNARGESIFEKPSFRNAAKQKRCLIYVNAFYEHHHYKGKTYPFRICLKDGSPMILAGLWEEWVNKETGEIIPTFTIVTTKGNTLLAKIHNNPKLDGPRMPVILSPEKQDDWLKPITNDSEKKSIEDLIVPFDESLLKAYTVAKLKGKEAIGNIPKIKEELIYPELQNNFGKFEPDL